MPSTPTPPSCSPTSCTPTRGRSSSGSCGGHDLHIYPQSNTRKPVLDILAGGGLLFIDTVERNNIHDPKALRAIQKEYRQILKKGGKK